METFEQGKLILEEKINGVLWEFRVSEIFHLSDEEYARNEAYNDTLGNYEPEKELPTDPSVRITASAKFGECVHLTWLPREKTLSPHVSKAGWSKSLFSKLKGLLINWELPNA